MFDVMQQVLKVGLIGLGNMGRNHLRVLSMLKGVDLAFVADANAEVAARAGEAQTTAIVLAETASARMARRLMARGLISIASTRPSPALKKPMRC